MPDPKHLTIFGPPAVATRASPVFYHNFVETIVLLESMAKGKCIEVQFPGVESIIALVTEARDRKWIHKTIRLVKEYRQ